MEKTNNDNNDIMSEPSPLIDEDDDLFFLFLFFYLVFLSRRTWVLKMVIFGGETSSKCVITFSGSKGEGQEDGIQSLDNANRERMASWRIVRTCTEAPEKVL